VHKIQMVFIWGEQMREAGPYANVHFVQQGHPGGRGGDEDVMPKLRGVRDMEVPELQEAEQAVHLPEVRLHRPLMWWCDGRCRRNREAHAGGTRG